MTSEITNDMVNATAESVGAGIDMSFGVFPIMTIIAGLFIATLATRLAYIDKQHGRIIKSCKKREAVLRKEMESNKEMNVEDRVEMVDLLLENKDALATHISRRAENRRSGVAVDMLAILFIIGIGLSTVVFKLNATDVSVALVFIMIPSLFNFVFHLYALRDELLKF